LNAKKIKQSAENLEKSVCNLRTALKQDTLSDLELSGILKYFELCYELSWKTLKKRGEALGRRIASPREAFQYALEAGIITNESPWIDMIEDRNLSVHVYDRDGAEQIYKKIKARYLAEFEKLVLHAPE